MNKFVQKITSNRFGLVLLLTFLLVAISTLTRLALFTYAIISVNFSLLSILGILALGLFFDLVNATYFMIPLLLLLWLMPERLFQKKGNRIVLLVFFFLLIFILLFNATAEGFFWEEFNTRFNFIAVDYLVYTTEVVGNIRQSYPIEWIIAGLLVLSLLTTFAVRKTIFRSTVPMRFGKRTVWFLVLASLPFLSFLVVDSKLHHFSDNTYANELAGNGMYELFSAYLNNELDYDQFYPTLAEEEAEANVRTLMQFSAPDEGHTGTLMQRMVKDSVEENRLNVVLISVESLSADFMETFGNDKHITPFLDSLAHTGLLFTNLYATGTRTVRGLEALSLSVPPTPGQSIVRRPKNEHLFSMASVFNAKGYESKFIFGGYGYFDNMGYFFANNGYEVIDRNFIPDEEIAYENIWGVADENLFTLAIHEIDKTIAQNKPIFAHVMTTSNHRPYTYPEGRIDIPSHTGRDGAVKYTDYALGKFIREASKKPWYSSTLFIIVADHCASSAGKTDLPVDKYHIPMIVFSPGEVEPGVQDRLMSQIDIAPTILGLLHFSYSSKFFGYDIYNLPEGKERAFISTYQLLGYVTRDSLVILAPKKNAEVFITGKGFETIAKAAVSAGKSPVVTEALSWYQTASHAFKNGDMKDGVVTDK